MAALVQTYPGLITAGGAFVIWILTRWVESFRAWQRDRREKDNFIRALFAEVDFNTRDLEGFQMNSASLAHIEKALRADKALRPHITDARHTLVYASNIGKVHFLDDDLAARLVLFYGLLEKIKAQVDGVNLPSFATVSANGKIATIKELIENVKECEKAGNLLLSKLAESYPKLSLIRHHRRLTITKQSES